MAKLFFARFILFCFFISNACKRRKIGCKLSSYFRTKPQRNFWGLFVSGYYTIIIIINDVRLGWIIPTINIVFIR